MGERPPYVVGVVLVIVLPETHKRLKVSEIRSAEVRVKSPVERRPCVGEDLVIETGVRCPGRPEPGRVKRPGRPVKEKRGEIIALAEIPLNDILLGADMPALQARVRVNPKHLPRLGVTVTERDDGHTVKTECHLVNIVKVNRLPGRAGAQTLPGFHGITHKVMGDAGRVNVIVTRAAEREKPQRVIRLLLLDVFGIEINVVLIGEEIPVIVPD